VITSASARRLQPARLRGLRFPRLVLL
jgi:hypothetical protein